MGKKSKSFLVTGVANTSVEDAGLASTESEVRRCTRIFLNLTGHAANKIQVWLEREKLQEWYDYHFQTPASSGSTNVQFGSTLLHSIDVDVEIPAGQTLKVVLACGGTNKNVYGSYEYEVE